jgi:hypothetical protein
LSLSLAGLKPDRFVPIVHSLKNVEGLSHVQVMFSYLQCAAKSKFSQLFLLLQNAEISDLAGPFGIFIFQD